MTSRATPASQFLGFGTYVCFLVEAKHYTEVPNFEHFLSATQYTKHSLYYLIYQPY